MALSDLRYWHWLAIAIAAALLAVLAHRWSEQDAGAACLPADLSGQEQRFERALSGRVQGQPLLQNITVYPRQITAPDGTARPVHLVTARYCSGLPEEYDRAQRYVWRASVFVFPIPYQPTTDLARSDPELSAALAKRSPDATKATVLDLLAAARSVRGIGYSYAWWDAHFVLLTAGGCLLLLGVILPNALHVSRFGHLKPLRKRKPGVVTQAFAAPETVASADVGPNDDSSADTITPNPHPTRPVVAALSARPTEPTAAPEASESDPASFGMHQGDYYPTVRHHPDSPPSNPKGKGS